MRRYCGGAAALACALLMASFAGTASADLLPHCASGFGETGSPAQDCPDEAVAKVFAGAEVAAALASPDSCAPNDYEAAACVSKPAPADVPLAKSTYYLGSTRGGCEAFRGGNLVATDGRNYSSNGHVLLTLRNSLRYCHGKPSTGSIYFYVRSFKKNNSAKAGTFQDGSISPGGLISHDFGFKTIVYSGCGTITRFLLNPSQEYYLRCAYVWRQADF